jgi:hypothetical protein
MMCARTAAPQLQLAKGFAETVAPRCPGSAIPAVAKIPLTNDSAATAAQRGD